MIFVSVGTTKYPFPRLVRTVDRLAPELDDRVFVQAGCTLSEYTPRHAEYTDYVSREEYDRLVAESDRVVSHAGTGSIITALRAETPILLVPRAADRGEHINDHQSETARGWEHRTGVEVARSADELRRELRDGDVASPTYESDGGELQRAIGEALDRRAVEESDDLTVFCPSPPGGHLTQLLELRSVLDRHDTRYLTWDEDITGAIEGVELIDGYHPREFPAREMIRNFAVSKAQIARLAVGRRPDIVLSTGGGDLVLYTAYLAKILGADVIHVESMTRFDSSSTTGRFLYPIADRFFVQHQDVASEYGEKAEYCGTLF